MYLNHIPFTASVGHMQPHPAARQFVAVVVFIFLLLQLASVAPTSETAASQLQLCGTQFLEMIQQKLLPQRAALSAVRLHPQFHGLK